MWPRPPTGPSVQGPSRVRLIVRRVRPTPGSASWRCSPSYAYHAFITDPPRRHCSTSKPITAATPRSKTPSATSNTGSGLNHLPSGRFGANAAWLAPQRDRPQPGPLDQPHRPGRRGPTHDHQNPAHPPAGPTRTTHSARAANAPFTYPRGGPGSSSSAKSSDSAPRRETGHLSPSGATDAATHQATSMTTRHPTPQRLDPSPGRCRAR